MGPVGLIDIINYLAHAQNKIISRNGFIAVGSARFFTNILPDVGKIIVPNGQTEGSVNI